MNSPLVTVVIPTYKRTDYLSLTLVSIHQQTFQDFEIIVVDDGSPGNENFLLCEQFEKVKYIKIENSGGPARPRNVGIKEARGSYIAFVDDDDIWLPNKLKTQVEILKTYDDYGLVHCFCELIDENGILLNNVIGRHKDPFIKHGDVSLRMMGNWTLMMPTPMIRKEIIEKVGLFNEDIPAALEDAEFWIRCSFETKFYYIDEPLVHYRVHSNNISNATDKYVDLPLYLRNVLLAQYRLGRIKKTDFKSLRNNLTYMQLRNVNKVFFQTLKNVFSIDILWFLRKNSLKMVAYLLFFKK